MKKAVDILLLLIFSFIFFHVIFPQKFNTYSSIKSEVKFTYIMETQTLITILTAVVGALATIIAALLPFYISERKAKKSQRYKLFYVKFHYLMLEKEGAKPLYKRFIPRLDKEIDIFSEVHCYRLNVFSHDQSDFTFSDRSSGVIDLQILHPNQDLIFSDEKASNIDGYVTQTVNEPSKVYFTRSVYLNGFKPKNEDMGIKMEKNTDEARIIADFTSIPGYENIIKNQPKGYFRRGKVLSEIEVQKPFPGGFSIGRTRLKKGDVIRIDFDIDWEKLKTR